MMRISIGRESRALRSRRWILQWRRSPASGAFMKSAFGCIVAALAFAASAHETSTPVRVGTLPLVTCKNHFILDEPCGPLDTTIPVPTAIAVDAQGNVFFSGPNIVY